MVFLRLGYDCGANTDPRTLAVVQHRLRANSSASATSCPRSQVRRPLMVRWPCPGEPARPSKSVPPRGISSLALAIDLDQGLSGSLLSTCGHPALPARSAKYSVLRFSLPNRMCVLLRRRLRGPLIEFGMQRLAKKLDVGGATRHLTDSDRTVQWIPQTAR